MRVSSLRKMVSDLRSDLSSGVDKKDLRATVDAMRATIPVIEGESGVRSPELPKRWYPHEYHPEHAKLWVSKSRFNVIEAGRRSGKSEIHKRKAIIFALDPDWPIATKNIVIGAPTHDQARKLYWEDLLAMIPRRFVRKVSISRRAIELANGATIYVLGMDRPERAEGFPIDGLFLDEFANMRPEVWTSHLRPSLATPRRPLGVASFYGTPDMAAGDHFIALADMASLSQSDEWTHFRWTSEGLVDDAELEAARLEMSRNEFEVEYLAKRVAMGSLAYHEFDRIRHVVDWLVAWPNKPLALCLDFNHRPGIAVICQEQHRKDYEAMGVEPPADLVASFTAVVGEIYIDASTNIREVMDTALDHPVIRANQTKIVLYGDPAGGAAAAGQTEGSCWDIVYDEMRQSGKQWDYDVARAHPTQVARVNAMNRRLRNAMGQTRMLFAAGEKPGEGSCATIKDVERVTWKDGVLGKLNKVDLNMTHCSDALGYYIELAFRRGRDVKESAWLS